MKIKTKLKYTILLSVIGMAIVIITGFNEIDDISKFEQIDHLPAIKPDYIGITIPPNIGPMNFNIEIEADKYLIKAYSDSSDNIKITTRSSVIKFPIDKWHQLLGNNKGKYLNIDIYTKIKGSGWQKYKTITNKIAEENIDDYILYRKIHPAHFRSRENGPVKIVEQNLTTLKSRVVITGESYHAGCVNCHSPLNNKTDKMTFGIRSSVHGVSTLYIENDKVQKLGVKLGYNSWHNSGKIIAYSTNNLPRFFHSAKNEVRDTVDLNSYIAYYDTRNHKVTTVTDLAKKKKLETFPMWSADGKWLYYCSADMVWSNPEKLPPNEYDKVRYDLMRISYDINKDIWGKPELVLAAEQTGKSTLMPRTSPDGKWLVYCLTDYGAFPAWLPSSDLYITDLKKAEKTGKFNYKQLSINTNQSQSWHCFSSNSKWLVYSSKQQNGLFTRIYVCYIDKNGQSRKSFIIPQINPNFYDRHLMTFSFPELTVAPVSVSAQKLAAAVIGNLEVKVDIPITMASPKKKKYPKTLTPYAESE